MKIRFRQAAAAALALCLLLACCPFAALASSGTCGVNASWEFDEQTGALTISGTGAISDYSNNTVTPWYAFCQSIKSVTILSGIRKIGKCAFEECANLESVTISDSVAEIGSYAFYNCTRLLSVTIPNALTKIGAYAFRNCTGLADISLPASVTSIGSYAFDGVGNVLYSGSASGSPWGAENRNRYAQGVFVFDSAEKQTLLWCSRTVQDEVTIPDSVREIGGSAFTGCADLSGVTIPQSTLRINGAAFYGCASLSRVDYTGTLAQWCAIQFKSYTSNPLSYAHALYIGGALLSEAVLPNDLTEIGSYVFQGCACLTDVTIPEGVTRIRSNAFQNCTGLTDVTIPDTVSEIDASAFDGCTGLAHVSLGSGLETLGTAFTGCTSLTAFSVSAENSVFSTDENGVLYHKNQTELILYPIGNPAAAFTIPNGVTSVRQQAFYGCVYLQTVQIPADMTEINDLAFDNCASLVCITIPNGVTRIGTSAFRGCTNLSDVTIGSGVTQIGSNAFSGCTALANIAVPDTVTQIGENAFALVGNLVYSGTADGSPWGAAYLNRYAEGIFVFDGTDKQTLLWCSRAASGEITVPDGVTQIERSAFENCALMTGVTIPEGVTAIGEYQFALCRSLQSVRLPNTLQTIASHAFTDTILARLDIPDGMVSLGAESLPATVRLITVSDAVTDLSGDNPFPAGEAPEFMLDTGNGLTRIPDCLSGAYVICLGSGFNCSEDCLGSAKPHHVHLCNEITSLGRDALYGVNYICADADNTFAENYAQQYQMGFCVCEGHENGKDMPSVHFFGKSVFRRYEPETDTYYFYGSGPMFDHDPSWDKTQITCARVVIEAGVTYVGGYLFENDSIGELVLPDARIVLCEDAFERCAIERVTFPQTAVNVQNYIIESDMFRDVLYLDLGGLDGFPNGFLFGYGDNYSLRTLVVGANTKTIPESLCNCFGALESLTLPDGLLEIGDYAFESCECLTSVVIPDSVTRIGAYAFDYCASLAQADLPDSLTQIGDYAFCCCAALTEVMIPSGVKTIGAEAFTGTGLQSVHLPAGLEEISPDAFDAAALSYVCCDTENCPVVRQYAEEAGIELRLCDGHGVVAPRLAGDANVDGSVDLKDVTAIRRYLAGGWNVTVDASNADVDADGRLTMRDVVLLSRYLAGGWDVILL